MVEHEEERGQEEEKEVEEVGNEQKQYKGWGIRRLILAYIS